VFFEVIASLMSGTTFAYSRGVDYYRRLQAVYIAEGGVVKMFAFIKENGTIPDKKLRFSIGKGNVEVQSESADGKTFLVSSGVIKNGRAFWKETVKVEIGNNEKSPEIKNYYWMGRNENN